MPPTCSRLRSTSPSLFLSFPVPFHPPHRSPHAFLTSLLVMVGIPLHSSPYGKKDLDSSYAILGGRPFLSFPSGASWCSSIASCQSFVISRKASHKSLPILPLHLTLTTWLLPFDFVITVVGHCSILYYDSFPYEENFVVIPKAGHHMGYPCAS